MHDIRSPGIEVEQQDYDVSVSRVRLKTYGDRAFSVAAPKLWNDLPLEIKLNPSVAGFKSHLETHLFRIAFR